MSGNDQYTEEVSYYLTSDPWDFTFEYDRYQEFKRLIERKSRIVDMIEGCLRFNLPKEGMHAFNWQGTQYYAELVYQGIEKDLK